MVQDWSLLVGEGPWEKATWMEFKEKYRDNLTIKVAHPNREQMKYPSRTTNISQIQNQHLL